MLRSLGGALLIGGVVVGPLLLIGTRPAAGNIDTAPYGVPPVTSATTAPDASTTTAVTTTTTLEPSPTTAVATSTTIDTTTTAPIPTPTTDPAGPAAAAPASSVEASNSVVGIGGTVEFNGTCDRSDFGAVVVKITGTTTRFVDTGLTGSSWSYRWTAPTDPQLISSFDFEFWCGDPVGATDARFPDSLRRRVDMVASVPTPAPTRATDPTQATLPETT